MGQLAYWLIPLETELPVSISLQLELGDLDLEQDVLDKVDLLGCAVWNPKDHKQ